MTVVAEPNEKFLRRSIRFRMWSTSNQACHDGLECGQAFLPASKENAPGSLIEVVVYPAQNEGVRCDGSAYKNATHPLVTAIPSKLELSPLYRPRMPSRSSTSKTASYTDCELILRIGRYW